MSRLTLHRVRIRRILVKKELPINTLRLPNTYVTSVVVAPAKSDKWSIVERKISAKSSEKYGGKFSMSRILCATREIRMADEDKRVLFCGEARSGQSRNAYQTQLKSDDTVPVTTPPPPIKTTRARVSPRNSEYSSASSGHYLLVLSWHMVAGVLCGSRLILYIVRKTTVPWLPCETWDSQGKQVMRGIYPSVWQKNIIILDIFSINDLLDERNMNDNHLIFH